MKLYLDDDSASPLLAQLLQQASHDVRLPAEFGLVGQNDPVHLTKAVQEGRVLLSHNHDDFEELHNLVIAVGGHHPGIFVVRKDNNPKRDLTVRGSVRAIEKLLAAQVPIADQFIILNHWR
jgi:predicted nuclease of predicted toxin-antitoxin system